MNFIKLLLLFVVFCFAKANAQELSSFKAKSNTWVNSYHLESWEKNNPVPKYTLVKSNNYCLLSKDTLINAINYRVLSYCDGKYKGAIREEDSRMFFIPSDSISEYILYDFNLNVGEGLTSIYSEDILGNPSIYNVEEGPVRVDSILIGDEYRRKLVFEGTSWIEGIGSTGGLFCGIQSNNSSIYSSLYCMSKNDTINFPFYMEGECNLQLASVAKSNMTHVSIAPDRTKEMNKELYDIFYERLFWAPNGMVETPTANFLFTNDLIYLNLNPNLFYSVNIGFNGDLLKKTFKIEL